MRSSRTFIVAGQLALLTLALASCGRQAVPEAPVGQVASEATAVQPATQPTQTAAAEIVTVRVLAGTTEADLLSRYPGARVLALHASEGYAQLLGNVSTVATPAMSSLSLNAQLVAVTATEEKAEICQHGYGAGKGCRHGHNKRVAIFDVAEFMGHHPGDLSG